MDWGWRCKAWRRPPASRWPSAPPRPPSTARWATPLRSVIAYDRAACLARRAEKSGDAFALAEAEAVFRTDLAARSAHADPVGWAVVQLALARVYPARAERRGELADAAFALTEALEVFTDHGQATLAQTTLATLEKVRGRRVD